MGYRVLESYCQEISQGPSDLSSRPRGGVRAPQRGSGPKQWGGGTQLWFPTWCFSYHPEFLLAMTTAWLFKMWIALKAHSTWDSLFSKVMAQPLESHSTPSRPSTNTQRINEGRPTEMSPPREPFPTCLPEGPLLLFSSTPSRKR